MKRKGDHKKEERGCESIGKERGRKIIRGD